MNKPNLETCTVQEACDYAVFKIVEQGKQCLGEDGHCVYYDGYGNHCAIGWLLDHENDDLMSSSDSISTLIRNNRYLIPKFIIDNDDAFSQLQMFHDQGMAHLRIKLKNRLSNYIDTSPPQYQKWVDMGEQL